MASVELSGQAERPNDIVAKTPVEHRDVAVADLCRSGSRAKRQAAGLCHIQVNGAVDADAEDRPVACKDRLSAVAVVDVLVEDEYVPEANLLSVADGRGERVE